MSLQFAQSIGTQEDVGILDRERAHARACYGIRRAFEDADEQAAYTSDSYFQRYVQLDPGRFKGQIVAIDLDGISLYHESVNRRVVQSGSVRGFSIILPCGPVGSLRCNGVQLDSSHAAILEANAEFEALCEATELVSITVTPRSMASVFHDDVSHAPRGGARVIPSGLSSQMLMSISAILSQVGAGQGLLDNLEWCALARAQLENIVATITGLLSKPGRGRREIRFANIIRRTRELLDDRPGDVPNVEDLCRKVGVSRRTLHYAFMAEFGTPPMHFLKAFRMSDARRAIREAQRQQQSIGDIAAQFGFFHPSHFSADYLRHFGELPSATARAAMRRNPSPAAATCGN